jgi:DNA-binding NtrC family response regulator
VLGQSAPKKRLSREALEKLAQHNWPGNVRELMHVLQRAAILAGDRREIGVEEIRYRRTPR